MKVVVIVYDRPSPGNIRTKDAFRVCRSTATISYSEPPDKLQHTVRIRQAQKFFNVHYFCFVVSVINYHKLVK
jgi:hypothetical protein